MSGDTGGGRRAGPGRADRRGYPSDEGTADLEHPARAAALGALGLCPARRSRRCGRPQGPARSGRRPGCSSARPGKGRGGPEGRARRRRGVPVALEGCPVSIPWVLGVPVSMPGGARDCVPRFWGFPVAALRAG